METKSKARTFRASSDDYHRSEGLSNSALGVFANDPALYEARFITKTVPHPEPSADMIAGTLLHEWILDGNVADAVMIPNSVLNKDGHRRGTAWTEWSTANAGKLWITEAELDDIKEMERAISDHPAANKLLRENGESEVNIRGVHDSTGVVIRGRIDRMFRGHFISDLKTTKDPSPRGFASSVANFGYHRQQVWYQSLVAQLTGESLPFFFIAIGKTKPYRVEVYQLADEFLVAAETEIDDLMRRFVECQTTGVWRVPHYGDVLTLPMPRWMNYTTEWETE